MIIVIDGYNVLKQVFLGRSVTERERGQFIAQLGKYARRKKHKIILVFDAGPHGWPHKERINGIQVVYSGVHETADDYIMRYLESHRSQDMLLVSSDHELNVWSSRLSIPSINSEDFYGLLKEALRFSVVDSGKMNSHAIKTTDQESVELDELMMQASQEIPTKADDVLFDADNNRTSQARKHSKKDRQLIKKLKKL